MVECLISCSICFEDFDREYHIPLLLNCGHTYCRACLLMMPEPLKCPECRTVEHRIPHELPKNILVYQLQSQINPNEQEVCTHEECKFYCKRCRVPVCVDCVTKHGSHGLLNLADPEIKEMIDQHTNQLVSTHKKFQDDLHLKEEQALQLLAQMDSNHLRNQMEVQARFESMQKMLENLEQTYLERVDELYQQLFKENNSIGSNSPNNVEVMVDVDMSWLENNLLCLGNIAVQDSSRPECSVRRSRNVKALNWKYSGRIDALTFRVDRHIMLTGLGVCTPYKVFKQTLITDLKILQGSTTRSKVLYLHSFAVQIPADFVSGVTKVQLHSPLALEPNTDYTAYLKISGSKTFKGVESMSNVTGRDGTVFTFSNTTFVAGDESNRTDVQCGPLVDFYYQAETIENNAN